MRIVYLGTPDFAVPPLEALVRSRHTVLAVVTQPDRPSGRGREVSAPPVKECALSFGLRIEQPERIRNPEFHAFLKSLAPDLMVVVGYGKIIPQTIIDIPPRGIVNIHASLLPKYRGAAPVQWAIASGETRTGVTTMLIDAGLDTGDILLQRETAIGPEENAIELSARLAFMGADLLLETLEGIEAGSIVPRKQDPQQASLAPILKKEDGLIDWRRPAWETCNRVRGFVPWPGAYTYFRKRLLHIWKARSGGSAIGGAPGILYAENGRLLVACGENTSLDVIELQMEGKNRISARAFLNGYRLEKNEKLGDISA